MIFHGILHYRETFERCSKMSSHDNRPQAAGLGQPLVTISQPVSRSIAVPAGDNHPLAAANRAIPVVAGTDVDEPPESTGHGNVAMPSTSGYPSQFQPTTPQKLQSSTPNSSIPPGSVPNVRVVPTSVSPSKSLDSLADAFLSEPSHRTEQLRLPPILKPAPLPPDDGILRLRNLVERRAWGDVLKVATSMLNAPDDPHSHVYAALVTLPLNAPKADAMSVSEEIRQETVECMALQCHAWLKLRRYADLETEVERWNFVTHNDATAESPKWLPWSLRKCLHPNGFHYWARFLLIQFAFST